MFWGLAEFSLDSLKTRVGSCSVAETQRLFRGFLDCVPYCCLTLCDICLLIGQDFVDSVDPIAVFIVVLMCFLVEDTQEYIRTVVLCTVFCH